jgi:O-antigen biosynthesis protein
MAFDLLALPVTFMSPICLSQASMWVTHIPFAYSITALTRPKLFVELGTHYGDSYLAFCQAVKALGLPTRCAAVDTWTGDVHAGFYGEDVFASVRAAHDQRYATFSQLLRMEFDTAAKSFRPGTIDLLHIDGLHTYEAVRHDYETWLPKLSPQGIVLFHDTKVLELNFGVHQLFAELAKKHPAFTFEHGCGLGVVAPGANPPAAVMEFLEYAAAHPREVESCYATLGNRVEVRRTLTTTLMVATEVQRSINTARRGLNMNANPATETIDAAMGNPLAFMDFQAESLIELLTRAGMLPGQSGK